MPFSTIERKYLTKKKKEAIKDLEEVGDFYRFRIPFFNQSGIIALPKIDKVDSLDTWLNNISNLFKTIFHFSEFALANAAIESDKMSYEYPFASFCFDTLASMYYAGVKMLEGISNLISGKDGKEDDQEIEMQPICQFGLLINSIPSRLYLILVI